VAAAKTTLYYPGDGTEVQLPVAYIADFPRGENGACAFCGGDPCAERTDAVLRIRDYYQRNPGATTCPMCDGRPT